MVFSSLEFLFFFLPVFFAVYAAVPGNKLKNAVIFIGSVIFYSLGVLETWVYIPLFLQTILINYLLGILMDASRKHAKLLLILGILYNVWWLLFFKYSGFFLTNLNTALHTQFTVRDILLPIGISFYTFQNISYIADVYRGDTPPEPNFINYGAYISMFPQLIAGPIVSYRTVREDLLTRTHTLDKLDKGLRTFIAGLGFKVLIANQLGGLWNDLNVTGYDCISTPLAWMGIAAFSFQLYVDFMGYSLMAIGLGLMMGFHLPQNFDQPYQSVTMTEFWRRWHITLGAWFRDYIYIPLGGNRHGTLRTVCNLLVVWLLTGFWHGASWNFILWGLFLFVILISEKFLTGKILNHYRTLGHFYMFLLIPLSWTLFAVTDLHSLGTYLLRLLPFLPHEEFMFAPADYANSWETYWKYFLAAVLFCTPFPEWVGKRLKKAKIVTAVWYGAILLSAIYCMYKGLNDPFLYFRF